MENVGRWRQRGDVASTGKHDDSEGHELWYSTKLGDAKIGGMMPQVVAADRCGKLKYASKLELTRKCESVVNAYRML
jgi:hypothetical protein